MTASFENRSPLRRARVSFWFFLGVAVLAAGSLSASLAAEPSPLTGLRVAASGVILVGSVALVARVMVGVERARRRAGRIPDDRVGRP